MKGKVLGHHVAIEMLTYHGRDVIRTVLVRSREFEDPSPVWLVKHAFHRNATDIAGGDHGHFPPRGKKRGENSFHMPGT